VVEHLLDPASPLYQEGDVLVAEDPTLVDKSLYWSVLQAIADGHRRRSAIAAAIGRPPTSVAQPLRVLNGGAWIELRPDALHARASTVLLTEPMLRTHRVLIAAERYRVERHQAAASGTMRSRGSLAWSTARISSGWRPSGSVGTPDQKALAGSSVPSVRPSCATAGGPTSSTWW